MGKTLQSLYRFIRFRPWILVLIFLVIVLCIAFILRALTPNQKIVPSIPVPKLESIQNTNFNQTQIAISTSELELPSTLTVFTASSQTIRLEELVSRWSLTPFPNSSTLFTSANKKQRLSFLSEEKRFEYRDTQHEGNFDEASVKIINTARAISVANSFIKEQFGMLQVEPVRSDLSFYKKESTHADPALEKEANLVAIPFSLLVENYSTFIGVQESYPLMVYVDSADRVTALSISQAQFKVEDSFQVPTIKLSDLPEFIKSGYAKITRIQSDDTNAFSLQQIESLTLDDISVAYRFVPDTGLIVPYLTIKASATIANIEKPVDLSLVVPAVKTNL